MVSYVTSKTNFLQIWRQGSKQSMERFKLIGQTKVAPPVGNYTKTLSKNEFIKVMRGDVLGFYFSENNPIVYNTRPCYTNDERLRYNDDLPDLSGDPTGLELAVQVPALTWNPCRLYSLQAIVGMCFLVHSWVSVIDVC